MADLFIEKSIFKPLLATSSGSELTFLSREKLAGFNDLIKSLILNVNQCYTSYIDDISYLGAWLNWLLTFEACVFGPELNLPGYY